MIISQCLRKSTLIWHSIELSTLKKKMLKNVSLINWYNALIRRFKKRTSIVLISMQNIKYIMNDVKQQKNFRLFAQNFFRIVKTANLTSIHNQLIIAWNNLAWQFRQHIFESIEHTTIREFLEQLNSQTSIWYEMIKSFNFIFRRYSKSYYQNNERNMNRFYFNRNSRFSNISNNAYQEYQKHHFRNENRRREKSRRDVIIKVEKKSNERKSDKNANERKFDRNSQNKIYDNFKHYEKNRTSHDRYKIENKSDYKNKDKVKTFIIERKDSLKLSKNSDNDDYNQFEDFAYFDFDDEKEFDISTLLATFIKVKCRQCHAFFFFNNRLHQHLRSASCCNKNHFKNNAKIILINEVIENTIIEFKINVNTNIDSEYEFKEWQYAIVDISLFKNEVFFACCIDTKAEIILFDTKFFVERFKAFVRIMTIFITVQDLNAQKHSTDKYAIASMYFADIDDKKRKVKTLITKKIHLIDNFKTNMLINNDILKSELIDISTFTKSAYVDSCEVTILIRMQIKTFSTRSVCAMKSIVISSLTELTISIHKIDAFNNDYIFEFDQANFFIYAHVINANIKVVLIRNDNFTAIKISRNLRFEKIIEMNYSNVCLMNFSVAKLILRRFKTEHKQFYWNKILKVYNFAVSDAISSFSDDTILFNEIIIHNSSQSTVKVFFKLVQSYFILWNNHDFANLSEKNWMRISLKTNWEFKIKEKVKMYSVEVKNKEIIDKTFNKLHDEKKLS